MKKRFKMNRRKSGRKFSRNTGVHKFNNRTVLRGGARL